MDFDSQGHRGFRGKYPENTIQGFMKAIDTGVKTLEMDVVVTKDNQLIVSHEPYFSDEICVNFDGSDLENYSKEKYNIYSMTYDEVQKYDCGSKVHPRFPEQEKFRVVKPLLEEVIETSESYSMQNYSKELFYNIEIKSLPEGDSVFHPAPYQFAELLINKIKELDIDDRTYIQSFDKRALQAVKSIDPEIKTVLLVENIRGYKANIEELGFNPDVYSPEHTFVTKRMIGDLHKDGIKVIPWTVNESSEMKKLIEMGVDGIISDFPDILMEVLNK
ncbi:glycerophosphodiester phosphodiesterase [Flammeovirgaceae bacterium KN852]|uniref:Glycerophosphodiester phosphodiesterase n=2 Tax=Marinigracilibium pacificum TaxID=2729599 RepID=A0A848IZA3_9BACT|nr:glycerophosphodiester phosphodiesterase [Marinigracilibium pacificum]